MVMFSALEHRPVLHEILIAIFTIVTTPVTLSSAGARRTPIAVSPREPVPP